MRTMLRSKIHRATVTQADLNYEGSITLDPLLIEAADMMPYEQIHVLDVDNGNRLITYIIEGERGSGVVCINGAAARLVSKGDIVILLTYAVMQSDEDARRMKPHLVYVNEHNQITHLGPKPQATNGTGTEQQAAKALR